MYNIFCMLFWFSNVLFTKFILSIYLFEIILLDGLTKLCHVKNLFSRFSQYNFTLVLKMPILVIAFFD